MLNILLASLGDVKISNAALYALLGFVIVFLGITILITIVWLVGKLFSSSKSNTKHNTQPMIEEKTPVPVASADLDEIDEETLAVITAALMAYYQTNNPKCEFTVKRIKRI